MRRRIHSTGGIPGGLIAGLLLSLVVTVAGCGIVASLVEREIIGENNVDCGIAVIMILAAYAGATMSYRRIRKQRLLVCMSLGMAYFCTLLAITAVFFGAEYYGVWVTGVLIFCGSFLGIIPAFWEKRGGKTGKIKIANC